MFSSSVDFVRPIKISVALSKSVLGRLCCLGQSKAGFSPILIHVSVPEIDNIAEGRLIPEKSG